MYMMMMIRTSPNIHQSGINQ